jgi:hypothetical protein
MKPSKCTKVFEKITIQAIGKVGTTPCFLRIQLCHKLKNKLLVFEE